MPNSSEICEQVLLEIANWFEKAHRVGSELDEPEGSRYIQISDTLARKVAERCRLIAGFPDTTQISGSTLIYDFGFPNVEPSEDG